jgi:hypothetical protein
MVSIFIGWLVLRLLWPRALLYSEPPPPQLVIRLHVRIVPTERPAGPSAASHPPVGP